MISRLKGTLLTLEPDRIEIETRGGVVYEVEIPGTVAGRLPARGSEVEVLTHYVVREDAAILYGFLASEERELFTRLLDAKGVGGKVAIALLTTYNAPRLARAIVEKDVTALTQVTGVGKKTANQIILDLSDKVQDLAIAYEAGDDEGPSVARDAVSALVGLGFAFTEADELVRKILEDEEVESTEVLVRKALAGRAG